VKELVEVRQVRRAVEGESSEDIAARRYCMVCVEIYCFGYLNLERRESCECHEMREIREGHSVKSSKGFEGVVLVRVPRLDVKKSRIEQTIQHEDGLPIVLNVHKCNRQGHAGQGMYTEGGSLTNIRQEAGSYICRTHILTEAESGNVVCHVDAEQH
jgi:hypothetical protein